MKSYRYLLLLLLTGCQTYGLPSGSQTWSKLTGAAHKLHFQQGCGDIACSTCPQPSGFAPAAKQHSQPHCGTHGWGCFGPESWKTKHLAKKLASENLPKECHKNGDYKHGFEQAFVDVAMGTCGRVPVFPPHKYQKECGRTADGHAHAQVWFQGYAAGAQIALSYSDRFLDVATSQHCGYEQPYY